MWFAPSLACIHVYKDTDVGGPPGPPELPEPLFAFTGE